LAIRVALVKLSAESDIRGDGRSGVPLHVMINIVASLSQPQTAPNPTRAQVRRFGWTDAPQVLGGVPARR
jgi:hypothetical protein